MDKWGNIWWLYQRMNKIILTENKSDTFWHNKKPGDIYTTLMKP